MVRVMWKGQPISSEQEAFSPPMDVYETETAVIIELELPGAPKEGMEVWVESNLVRVEGEKGDIHRSLEEMGARHSFLQLERKFGRFYREIVLPTACNTNEVKATLNQGFLRIVFKKIPERRGVLKKIPVE